MDIDMPPPGATGPDTVEIDRDKTVPDEVMSNEFDEPMMAPSAAATVTPDAAFVICALKVAAPDIKDPVVAGVILPVLSEIAAAPV